MDITVTNNQKLIINAILELLEFNIRTPNKKEKKNISAFSISKKIGIDKRTVKTNILTIKEKL